MAFAFVKNKYIYSLKINSGVNGNLNFATFYSRYI